MTPRVRSGFVRNVLTLMAGTSIAQVVTVAISPVLTRFYEPADFGVFAALSAITSLTAVISTGRYEVAVPLPHSEQEGSQLVGLAMLLSVVTALVVLAVVLVFGDAAAVLIGGEKLGAWLYVVPGMVVVMGATQALQYWLTRRSTFRPIATAGVAQSIVAACVNLAVAPLHAGPLGLITGLVAGQVVALCVLSLFLLNAPEYRPSRLRWQGMRAQAVAQVKFPKFDLPNALSYALSQRGILVLITGFFTRSAVGMYSLTERVILSPFAILTNAYGQVFYQRLAETWRTKPAACGDEVARGMTQLARLLALPFIALAVSCKFLVPIVFGTRWADLYLYVLIMAPNAFLTLIVAPAGNVLRVVDRQDLSLLLNARLFVCRFAALAIAARALHWGIYRSLLVLSATTFIIVLANMRTILRQVQHGFPRLLLLVGVSAVAWYAAVLLLAMPHGG